MYLITLDTITISLILSIKQLQIKRIYLYHYVNLYYNSIPKTRGKNNDKLTLLQENRITLSILRNK